MKSSSGRQDSHAGRGGVTRALATKGKAFARALGLLLVAALAIGGLSWAAHSDPGPGGERPAAETAPPSAPAADPGPSASQPPAAGPTESPAADPPPDSADSAGAGRQRGWAQPAVGDIAASARSVYALTKDRSAVYEWTLERDWSKVGGPADALYAGDAGLFATSPDGGKIFEYGGTPQQWHQAGDSGSDFAVNAGGEGFGVSPDGKRVYRWTYQQASAAGDLEMRWRDTGPLTPAGVTTREKLRRLEELTSLGDLSRGEFFAVRAAHLSDGAEDRYEFNWEHNGCSSFPEKYLGFDFTAACIRHDFGYRNYKKLLGEENFRRGVPGDPGPPIRRHISPSPVHW